MSLNSDSLQILSPNSDSRSVLERDCDEQSPRRCAPFQRTRSQVSADPRTEGADAESTCGSVWLPVFDDRRRRVSQPDAADNHRGNLGASTGSLTGLAGLRRWNSTRVDRKGIWEQGAYDGLL